MPDMEIKLATDTKGSIKTHEISLPKLEKIIDEKQKR